MERSKLISKIQEGVTEIELEGVEFKSSWHQGYGKDISAIANNESIKTGWLVIGINDDGALLIEDKNHLRDIEQKISGHIRQYLVPSSVVKVTSEKIHSSHCLST